MLTPAGLQRAPTDFLPFVLDSIVRVAPIPLPIASIVDGTRRALGVSTARATTAAIVGVALGLATMEAGGNAIAMLLAPTGLV